MPVRQPNITSNLSDDLRAAFQRTISITRWGTYLTGAGFRENVAFRLYLWNSAIGQSLLFPVQASEVALRNVISAAIIEEFGENWFRSNYCLDVLGDYRREDIEKTARRIINVYNIVPESGHIISSLMLGFWCALLKRQYDLPIWDNYVPMAFPHLSDKTIEDVDMAATRLKTLRNRIVHHEPLIGRNLSEDYGNVLKLLGWICPHTREWVRSNSSVPAVLRTRPR